MIDDTIHDLRALARSLTCSQNRRYSPARTVSVTGMMDSPASPGALRLTSNPHYLRTLLLQSCIRYCDKPAHGFRGVQAGGLAAPVSRRDSTIS